MATIGLLNVGVAQGDTEPLHQCAVQLKLNSHDAGYNGSGTGTLVKHGDGYYLVTALHNLQRADNKLTIVFGTDAFFSTDYFASHFISVADSDLAVAKFAASVLPKLTGKRFVELLRDSKRTRVQDPTPGQSLSAVGNPVFTYEYFQGLQTNIVYHGTVAEYATPGIVVGTANAYIKARMMVVESLSVMPGFSGGPLLLIRDGEGGIGDVAGIVVGGDPRSIVSPGRFVFAVAPTVIQGAILALEGGLKDPSRPVPEGMTLAKTDVANVPKSQAVGLRYTDRVVVIDVTILSYLYQVQDPFLARIAAYVKNADMVFHGGRFGDVNLRQLQPSRATFVNCTFTNENALARANLMGARFVDCTVIPPGGQPRPVKVLPTLGYGITVIEGLKRGNVPSDPIFVMSDERMAAIADTTSEARPVRKSAVVRATAPPTDQRVKVSKDQFENLLTRDLFNDE